MNGDWGLGNGEWRTTSVVHRSSIIAHRFRRRPRRAFTLLEVLLALAILVGSLAVVGQLAEQGLSSARYASSLAEAQLLCESKMAEFTSGVTVPSAVNGVPLDVEGIWLYSVAVEPLTDQTLSTVRVTVSENLPPEKRPIEFSLVRRVQTSLTTGDETTSKSSNSTEAGT